MPLMPLRLSGLNVDGWFVAGTTPEHLGRFMSDGDLAQIASWRLTHLRLPVDDAPVSYTHLTLPTICSV